MKPEKKEFNHRTVTFGYHVKVGDIDPYTGEISEHEHSSSLDGFIWALQEIADRFGEQITNSFYQQIDRMEVLLKSMDMTAPSDPQELVYYLLASTYHKGRDEAVERFNNAINENDFAEFGLILKEAFQRRIKYLEKIHRTKNAPPTNKRLPPVNELQLKMIESGKKMESHRSYILRLADKLPRENVLTHKGYCSTKFLNIADVRKYVAEHGLNPRTVKNWIQKYYPQ